MEQRVARWITHIVGGSYIVAAMLIALIWFIVSIANGDFDILLSTTTLKVIFWGLLYIFSIYLVYSLKGKNIKRRLASWSFSVLFHVSLLLYVEIVFDAGVAAFIIGIPETIIIFLSSIGLASCIWSHYQHHNGRAISNG